MRNYYVSVRTSPFPSRNMMLIEKGELTHILQLFHKKDDRRTIEMSWSEGGNFG